MQYITMVINQPDMDKNPKRKTNVWDVVSITHGNVLGQIRWYGPWRQYVFRPAQDTIWSKGCLEDIEKFLKEANTR